MKKRIWLIGVVFLFSFLFFPGDGDSKGGGGRGGGGRGMGGFGRSLSRGGKFGGGLRPGHVPSYHSRSSSFGSTYWGLGTGLFLGGTWGAGYSSFAPSGCHSCHPDMGWFDRFRTCTYRNVPSPEMAEERLLSERDMQTWRAWGDRDPYIGP